MQKEVATMVGRNHLLAPVCRLTSGSVHANMHPRILTSAANCVVQHMAFAIDRAGGEYQTI
jgi:hypothetical protein